MKTWYGKINRDTDYPSAGPVLSISDLPITGQECVPLTSVEEVKGLIESGKVSKVMINSASFNRFPYLVKGVGDTIPCRGRKMSVLNDKTIQKLFE